MLALQVDPAWLRRLVSNLKQLEPVFICSQLSSVHMGTNYFTLCIYLIVVIILGSGSNGVEAIAFVWISCTVYNKKH